MTDHAELRRLAKAATPGPWTLYVPEDYQGPEELPGYGVECAEGRAIVWGALEPETGCQFDRDAEFIAAANPKTILAMLDEIDGLRSRLEIDERTPHDGIACRDETIKVLDEKCDRLKVENERLLDELSACTEHPGGCGYWREAAKRRAEERDRLRAQNDALRGALHAVQAEVDGNLRPLTRDLVNMVSGLNNGTHPNDIYDHCDEIERIIDAALKGATQ
ncbi:ead/Ea22-like family protein [Pseudomonas aeruginosa]|nr:ead/Ea22-like family protein [Pseudomonas aeruginosa]